MATAISIPSEDEEQAIVVQYCRLNKLDCFRVPNETFTKSWAQKRKNKRLGVSPGVPDLFVIVDGRLIAIEMKRIKRGVVTEAQVGWIKRLNDAGVEARVCHGADQAIAFIERVKHDTAS